MLWVRIPLELVELMFRSCGAVRSARHPVKVEVAGSNPVGNALRIVVAKSRKSSRQSRSGTRVEFRFHPVGSLGDFRYEAIETFVNGTVCKLDSSEIQNFVILRVRLPLVPIAGCVPQGGP